MRWRRWISRSLAGQWGQGVGDGEVDGGGGWLVAVEPLRATAELVAVIVGVGVGVSPNNQSADTPQAVHILLRASNEGSLSFLSHAV